MKTNKPVILFFTALLIFCTPAITGTSEPSCREKEVTFRVGDITLAGTLTLPGTPGPNPGIILISGGNANDRDSTVGPFKPFKIMARHFAQKGFAVLRFDDRGIGKSTGKHTWQYTVEDYANDVIAAIGFLKKEKEIDADKIGLCGHCLGGIIALLANTRVKNIAFIITMATPITTGEDIWRDTRIGFLESQQKKQEINAALELEKQIYKAVRNGENLDNIKQLMIKNEKANFAKLPDHQKKHYKNFDSYFATTYDGNLIKTISTPFYKHFLDYDPLPSLKKVSCPLLVLLGGADLLVPINVNKEKYYETLKTAGHKNFFITVIPKAEHHFIETWTKPRFVEGFPEVISNWLLKRFSKNP